eukprot:1650429-Pyramimonas_sp.AAC.1
MTTIRSIIKSMDERARWPFDHVKLYPDSPAGLPQTVLDFACDTGPDVEPPPEVTKQAMDAAEDNAGYHSTHGSFKGAQSAGQMVSRSR